MKKALKFAVVLISCACMCACTSMQVVASGQEQSLAYSRGLDKTRDVDDILYVMTKDGNRYEVKVKDFSVDGFDSANADGTKQHIQVDQIASIQRVQPDTGRTLGLLGAIVLGCIVLVNFMVKPTIDDMFRNFPK